MYPILGSTPVSPLPPSCHKIRSDVPIHKYIAFGDQWNSKIISVAAKQPHFSALIKIIPVLDVAKPVCVIGMIKKKILFEKLNRLEKEV